MSFCPTTGVLVPSLKDSKKQAEGEKTEHFSETDLILNGCAIIVT